MQLFYSPDIAKNNSQYTFNKEESKHIAKVLRKKEGQTLCITNGKGSLFIGEIIVADIKNCVIEILSEEQKSKHNYHLHIAIAPTKMNDRMEWFLEKAVEIGIDEITPIFCDNSERKIIKPERFEKIIQSAMKQSLQAHLPRLNDGIDFRKFIDQNFEGQTFIAHCEEQEKKELFKEIKNGSNITILIGPEGDFSTKEISLALSNNFAPISLGNTRLRTETAGIVACHTTALANNKS
ncbi:16S rRNA (uracil(1498)-N(3))-methyltransferase [Pseudofulvibacter geojedonensis]|uniref:Ribosomal RNA small subunit methyltransferase E n=1 Tax=Pseudofulvibacter geojedonensis TaxID=1123758 RepID=A0ABW3I3H7_9FLAO